MSFLSLFRRKSRPLQAGDLVPDGILEAWERGENVGAMISVCPGCKRIKAIFIP